MRSFLAPVAWAVLLTLSGLVGTGCRSGSTETGLNVEIRLNGLAVDQLVFFVAKTGETLVDHQRRPMAPDGGLADPQVVEIYVRDDLNSFVTIEVTGLTADLAVGTSSVNKELMPGKLVPVTVVLEAVVSQDGGAERAADDPVEGGDTAALPLGTGCALDDDCRSGLCVDGVCCASTCGACFACNLARHEGTCAPLPSGTQSTQCQDQNTPCGFDGTCDGNGGCFIPGAGQTCKAASCDGANLAPPGACDGRGTCLTPVNVSCAPFLCDETGAPHCRTECAGPTECAGAAQCTSNSCGERPKKAPGDGCVADADCQSGFCTDGVCCNARCDAQCTACNQSGKLGTCLAAAAMTVDPHHLCQKTPVSSCGTSGLCTGTGACQMYLPGTVCEEAQCADSAVVGAKKCDGSGLCASTGNQSCFPFRCNPATKACGGPLQ